MSHKHVLIYIYPWEFIKFSYIKDQFIFRIKKPVKEQDPIYMERNSTDSFYPSFWSNLQPFIGELHDRLFLLLIFKQSRPQSNEQKIFSSMTPKLCSMGYSTFILLNFTKVEIVAPISYCIFFTTLSMLDFKLYYVWKSQTIIPFDLLIQKDYNLDISFIWGWSFLRTEFCRVNNPMVGNFHW